MNIGTRKLAGTVVALSAAALLAAVPVTAAAPTSFRAALAPVPHNAAADGGSNVSGRAELRSLRTNVLVNLTARGLSPNLGHVAHIHGDLEAQNECPGIDADSDGNGLIDTLEGLPAYGPVLVTFSTEGDTSPASAFDVSVAPVADSTGALVYERSIKVSDAVRTNLQDLHIVLHGLDLNGNGVYDGPISSAGVPLELELPVACGTIN